MTEEQQMERLLKLIGKIIDIKIDLSSVQDHMKDMLENHVFLDKEESFFDSMENIMKKINEESNKALICMHNTWHKSAIRNIELETEND